MSLFKIPYFIYLLSSVCCASCVGESLKVNDPRPNIVLIMADDLGFSDLGCFGSEIATPHIDALAGQGQVFNNFYTAATCSPTRAMLLSGCDNHVAGLGDMAERSQYLQTKVNQPGYEGYLNDRVISVAQLLKDAGYDTYMAGKWHLGRERSNSPQYHGFERSFALLDAYANHFYPDPRYSVYWEDDDYVDYPNGSYSTELYTDKLIDFTLERKDSRPFFMYAAYTAPHWPLQAPPEYILKNKGKYDKGYDYLRQERFESLKKMGIIDSSIVLSPLPANKGTLYQVTEEPLLAWEDLSLDEKRLEAHKMEIYAAMIQNLDDNVGRLIAHLKAIGEYENTYFIFVSDNGAAPSEANQTPDPSDPYAYMGTQNSFVAYGSQWAHACSVPFSLYKGYSTEGGIHSPMIIKQPIASAKKEVGNVFCTIKDLAPTFLDMANTTYPVEYKGRPVAPIEGESILPYLNGTANEVHDEDYVMGWELFGRYALRKGHWKITQVEAPFGEGKFALYDLKSDPTEMHNVVEKYPEKYLELLKHWEDYVNRNGVILTNY